MASASSATPQAWLSPLFSSQLSGPPAVFGHIPSVRGSVLARCRAPPGIPGRGSYYRGRGRGFSGLSVAADPGFARLAWEGLALPWGPTFCARAALLPLSRWGGMCSAGPSSSQQPRQPCPRLAPFPCGGERGPKSGVRMELERKRGGLRGWREGAGRELRQPL